MTVVRNTGRRLRTLHWAALAPEQKLALNYRESRRLMRLNPDYGWRRFAERWRQRQRGARGAE